MTDPLKWKPLDGGPAFPKLEELNWYPKPGQDSVPDYIATTSGGMSLRDWLVGMALQGLCAQVTPDYTCGPTDDAIVERAFSLADEVIKRREYGR